MGKRECSPVNCVKSLEILHIDLKRRSLLLRLHLSLYTCRQKVIASEYQTDGSVLFKFLVQISIFHFFFLCMGYLSSISNRVHFFFFDFSCRIFVRIFLLTEPVPNQKVTKKLQPFLSNANMYSNRQEFVKFNRIPNKFNDVSNNLTDQIWSLIHGLPFTLFVFIFRFPAALTQSLKILWESK